MSVPSTSSPDQPPLFEVGELIFLLAVEVAGLLAALFFWNQYLSDGSEFNLVIAVVLLIQAAGFDLTIGGRVAYARDIAKLERAAKSKESGYES